jgi:carboxyl-terminal processing protease
VERLKKAQVDGIVLDVRRWRWFLSTVVDIAGLFIEQGPIVQIKSGRKKKFYTIVIKKSNDGPLVIMEIAFCFSFRDI